MKRHWLPWITGPLFGATCGIGAALYPRPSHSVGAIALVTVAAVLAVVYVASIAFTQRNYGESVERIIYGQAAIYSFYVVLAASGIYALGESALGWHRLTMWAVWGFAFAVWSTLLGVFHKKVA